MCYCSLLEGLWFVAERIGVRCRENWSSLPRGLEFVAERIGVRWATDCGLLGLKI